MPGRPRGGKALSLLRRYMPRLRWCPNCGAPVLGRDRCPRCGGPTLEVKLAPPGDARPAWDKEKRETWEAAVEQLGKEAAERLLGGVWAFWVFNPVQALDAADEVIVDGHTVVMRQYDPIRDAWVVRPDRVGVEILVEEELGPRGVVRGPLASGRVVEASIRGDVEPGGFLALRGSHGSYGVGRLLGDGKVRVVKAWKRRRRVRWRHKPRGLELVDAARLNGEWLAWREDEARRWLENVIRDVGGRALVGISGGKDSTVSAYVAASVGVEEAYTVDTGVEHPETLETVERVAGALGLVLHRVEAGNAFVRGFRAYGPPARDYRWCTKLLKLAPLSSLIEDLAGSGRALMIVGQRGAESPKRAAAGRLSLSGTVGRGRHYVAAPIQEWSSIEVYMFIVLRGLPLNPLYRLGFERIGCYMCPASHLAELRLVERMHPGLWARWMSMLRGFARRTGLPQGWAEYGFWRWRFSYPAEARMLAARLGLNADAMLERLNSSFSHASIEYGRPGVCVAASPPGGASLESVENLLLAAGLRARRGEEGLLVWSDVKGRVEVGEGGLVRLCGRAPVKVLRAAAAAVAMASACVSCRLCASSCPHGAIEAPPPRINPERCTGCGICMNVCPAGGNAAESILWSLLRLRRRAAR